MMQTINFGDEAHTRIANLEEENFKLNAELQSTERRLNYTLDELDRLRKDAKLGAALKVILKEIKDDLHLGEQL